MIETTRRSVLAGMAALPFVPGIAQGETVGSITRFDAGLDAWIDTASPIEVIATGYKWSEGPVWVKKGGYLLFSDVPANIAWRWTKKDGAKPFLSPSGLAGAMPAGVREGGSNGLTIDANGDLIMADSGTRAIARVDLKTRKKTIIVDKYFDQKFNSPNDVAIGFEGIIYFTDPPYGLEGGDKSPAKEIDYNGVYHVRPDGSDVSLIDNKLSRPNGIGLTGSHLYVSNSDPDNPKIFSCELALDGSAITELEPFVDFSEEAAKKLPGLPDGLKVARGGFLFASGPGGIYILSPEGKKLGLIATGKPIANCCFGEDGKTLFMTLADTIARVRLKASGW